MRRIFPFLAALAGCVTDAELEAALDRDRDGYLPVQAGGDDCDETRASVNPGADEVCGDGIDNDCDGIPDDDGIGARVFYLDQDGDGFGDDASESRTACSTPEGYAERAGDCDDQDPAKSPATEDLCDGIDNDCNGLVDEDAVNLLRFYDADGDQFGTDADTIQACQDVPGYVPVGGDCDDTDEATNPAALDGCDGIDRDCNGVVDDDAIQTLYFADADGDGAGDATSTVEACSPPPGHVETAGDCDDGDATIRPGALDPCDSIDQDCDGAVDEDASFTTWFRDNDGDGLGDADVLLLTCDGAPAQFVADAGDCNDDDASVTIPTWYADVDGDGHGASGVPFAACDAPTGFVASNDDCDDGDSNASPTLPEVCNNHVDDDCDPGTDCRLADTLSISDLPVLFELPGEVEAIRPFPDVLGTGAPNWMVKTDVWSILIDAAYPFDGTTTSLPCTSMPVPVRDLSGDGLADLYCVDTSSSSLRILQSGSLSSWSTIELPPGLVGSALPLESTSEGPGIWVQVASEARFYPRTGTGALDEDAFTYAFTCPPPHSMFEIEDDGTRLLVISCTTGDSVEAFAFPVDDVFDASSLDEALWVLTTPPLSFGGFGGTFLFGDREGSSFWRGTSTIVEPGFTLDFQFELFEPPYLGAPVPVSILDPPPGTVSRGFPAADLDMDGVLDWVLDTDGTRVDIAYGGPEFISLANTSTVILPNLDEQLEPFLSVDPLDLNGDAFDDLAIQVERDDGSRAVHVLYGSGQ